MSMEGFGSYQENTSETKEAVLKEFWKMKAHLFTAILFVGTLTGCRTRKMRIFLDQSWNRDNVKNACEVFGTDRLHDLG